MRKFLLTFLCLLLLMGSVWAGDVRLIANRCLKLNGGYATHANEDALDAQDGFMVEAWIKPFNLTGEHRIVDKSADFSFRTDGTALECGIFGASNFYSLSSTPVLSLNTWTYVLAWYDTNVDHFIHLCINGNEVSYTTQDDTGGQLITTGGTLAVGASVAPAAHFFGNVANIELWYFGTDSGVSYATYAARRFADPYGSLAKVMPGWVGYSDALRKAAGELTVDGGLESWTGDDLDSWTENIVGAGTVEDETMIKRSGAHSAKITIALDALNVQVAQTVTTVTGKWYELSAYIRGAAGAGEYAALSVNHNTTALYNTPELTAAFARYSVVFQAPDASTVIAFQRKLGVGSQVFYVDDVSLKRVGRIVSWPMNGNLNDEDEAGNAGPNGLNLTGVGDYEFVGSTVRATRLEGGTGKVRFKD